MNAVLGTSHDTWEWGKGILYESGSQGDDDADVVLANDMHVSLVEISREEI